MNYHDSKMVSKKKILNLGNLKRESGFRNSIQIKNCSRIALRRFPANEELFANRLAEIHSERGIMMGGLESGVGQ